MSASTGIALNAAAQSHSAQVTACQTFMVQFNGAAATVEQARLYAGCVDVMYPAPMSATDVLAIKVLIISSLLGMVIGLFMAHRDKWGRMRSDYIINAFFGAVAGPAVIFFVGLLVAGVKYLVTA